MPRVLPTALLLAVMLVSAPASAARPKKKDKRPPPSAVIDGHRVRLSEKIRFATGKAKILERSLPLLTALAGLLKEHPRITKLRIEGHAALGEVKY